MPLGRGFPRIVAGPRSPRSGPRAAVVPPDVEWNMESSSWSATMVVRADSILMMCLLSVAR